MKSKIRSTNYDSTLLNDLRAAEQMIGERQNDPTLLEAAIAETKDSLDRFLDSAEGDGAKLLLGATGTVIVIARETVINIAGTAFKFEMTPELARKVGPCMTLILLTNAGYQAALSTTMTPELTFAPITTDLLARGLHNPAIELAEPTCNLLRIGDYLSAATGRLAEYVLAGRDRTQL